MGWLLAACISTIAGASLFVLAVRMYLRRRFVRHHAGLFLFHDGCRQRAVDPITVAMALESHPEFRLDLDPSRALQDGDQQAMQLMADAVRGAFDVVPFTEVGKPGLTVFECVELLAVFITYLDLQKKSIKSPQISPPSTGPTSSVSDNRTTGSMSGSGSTGDEPQPSMV